MKRELPESQLPIEEQAAVLSSSLTDLEIKFAENTAYEVKLDLLDWQMLVRNLEHAPPLRAQIAAELHRVSRLYRTLAREVVADGLDTNGAEVVWCFDGAGQAKKKPAAPKVEDTDEKAVAP